MIASLYQKAERLETIVSDLLDLTRIHAGQQVSLEKVPLEICGRIGQVVAEYQNRLKHHKIETRLPGESVMVLADQHKLEQVLENLINNAVKFSPQGGPIQVNAQVQKDDFLVTVVDEGVGMSQEESEKIFDSFYRVDASNTAPEGLGLGMSIVKGVVEAHGGNVQVKSELGKGTILSFSIPL